MVLGSTRFVSIPERRMEHPVTVPPTLPPIEENRILEIDPDEVEEYPESDDRSGSDDERTSLLRSGHLSYSYSESVSRYMDTHEQDHKTLEVSSNADDASMARYQSSAMTDFQASFFLPSLLISSYSTVKHTYDEMARSMAQSMIKRSMYGSRSIAASLIERFSDDRGASFSLALFNLLPCLLGSGIFSLPYAVLIGGWVSIPTFLVISVLAGYTAMLLVECMYEISSKSKQIKRIRLDYVEVAQAAFGKAGGRVLNAILVSYLFAVNVIVLVLIGKSLHAILRSYVSLSTQAVMAIFSVLVIPTLFIQKLSHLAYLSMICTASVAVGWVSTTAVFIIQSSDWKENAAALPIFRWNGFALALSIWFYTIIVQSIVPQVEASMQEPLKFKRAVNIAVGTATPIKIVYGLMGALSYGALTKPLVTDNVSAFSYPVGVVANAVVCVFAVLNFPLNFFVVCDAFDSISLRKKHINLQKGGQYHYFWILVTRPVLVGIGLGIGIVVPYFELLVGVLGSLLGTLLVFLFPCLFHLKLKWRQLFWYQKAAEIMVLFTGCALGCIGLVASAKGLYFAISGAAG